MHENFSYFFYFLLCSSWNIMNGFTKSMMCATKGEKMTIFSGPSLHSNNPLIVWVRHHSMGQPQMTHFSLHLHVKILSKLLIYLTFPAELAMLEEWTHFSQSRSFPYHVLSSLYGWVLVCQWGNLAREKRNKVSANLRMDLWSPCTLLYRNIIDKDGRMAQKIYWGHIYMRGYALVRWTVPSLIMCNYKWSATCRWAQHSR